MRDSSRRISTKQQSNENLWADQFLNENIRVPSAYADE